MGGGAQLSTFGSKVLAKHLLECSPQDRSEEKGEGGKESGKYALREGLQGRKRLLGPAFLRYTAEEEREWEEGRLHQPGPSSASTEPPLPPPRGVERARSSE